MKSFTHLTYELSLIETLDAFQMGIGAYLKVSLEVRLGWFLVLLLFLKKHFENSHEKLLSRNNTRTKNQPNPCLVGLFLRSLRSKESAWSRSRILRLKKSK